MESRRLGKQSDGMMGEQDGGKQRGDGEGGEVKRMMEGRRTRG